MANEQNLKPFTSEQSREEAVKNGRKGGIKSGEARRLKAKMIEWAENGGYEKMVEKCDENLDNPRFWEMAASILGEAPTKEIKMDTSLVFSFEVEEDE